MTSPKKDSHPGKRRYGQLCPMARALDVVGERWTLLIIRNLLVGPQRYGELIDTLPGITTNLLAKRLKEMSARELILSQKIHGASVYGLSERGRALEPVVSALSRWGSEEALPIEARRHLRWAMLGIRHRYRGGVNGILRFACEDRSSEYCLRFSEDEVTFLEPIHFEKGTTVRGSEDDLLALVFGRVNWKKLRKKGSVSLEGSTSFLESCLDATVPLEE